MARHLHIVIVGLVQGVGYRAAFARKGNALQMSGWVRNRIDGSVEAVVCGNAEALDQMVDWAHHGPAGAQVSAVTVKEMADLTGARDRIEILPTE